MVVDLDGATSFDRLLRTAVEHHAALVVIAAGRHPDESVKRLAHVATLPLLVVRDPAPFARWGLERPLRAAVGWDDTMTTLHALAPIIALRRHAAVDIEIVHVYFPDEVAQRYGLHVASMVDPSPEVEDLLRRDIAHQLGEIPGAGTVTIVPTLGLGHIGEHLLVHIRRSPTPPDLIVAGTHHRGGLRRLSSVAERVLIEASSSVLLVPLGGDARIEIAPDFRVALVATDGSVFANRAIPYAYRMIPDAGEVHVIRVVSPDTPVDDHMADHLVELRPAAHTSTRTIGHVVRDRDPARAIATVAERVGADVVCIASHARTGIVRAVVGSVTDRLLHVCRRPVLVLHPVE
jgi:nucleotide-binding universal stress UspA family protein